MIDESLFKSTHSKESAVDSIVSRFRELIICHKIKPGDLLPSEGVLARQMGVSRGSVREAMKVLSALGVVDIRRGDGTYVSGEIGRALLDPFLLRLMINDYGLGQMLEFREMIEFDVIRAILRNKSTQGFELMKAAINRMEDAAANPAAQERSQWAGLDIAFHKAMAKATGNALIEQLYEFILEFFEPSIEETYKQPDNFTLALTYHKAILSAVEQGDEQQALCAVADSIAGWAAGEESR